MPYSDAIVDAQAGFAPAAPDARLAVRFSQQAETDLRGRQDAAALRRLIAEVLALDPRPAYRQGPEPERVYGMHLAGCNVRWQVDADGVEVLDVCPRPVG